MAEEKQKNKKLKLTKKILKWIGLGVLTFLIILGIIFQAPWKVTTLLIVFLLALTALPKKARKWFWLSAAGVAIALIIWVFLPEEDEGWRPYKFDEELAALEAKRAIPDEENAAIIYNQLLENYDSNSFYAGLPESERDKLPMREPWLRGEHPEIAEWLGKHQTTISMLLNASKIEKCRFPINSDVVSIGDTLDRLAPMRKWAYLLISAANNDIAEGRTEEGLEKYIAVLQMGKHQCQQPTMIDILVGFAIEALATKQLNISVVTSDATEERLNVIEGALAEVKHDWSADLPRILEGEKLMSKNFWGMFYAINPEGKIRLNPGIARRAMMAQLPKDMKDELVITYWHKRLMKAGTILCWFYMPSTPQEAAKITDASYERYYAMAEPNFDWQKKAEKPTKMLRLNYRYLVERLAEILGPAYYSIHDTYLQTIAQQKGSRLIIGLRRYKNEHGHWPERLDDIQSFVQAETLVDPINSSSFVYKLTEENFTLYSKGQNNIDDEVKRDTWEEETGKDDWLIWPPR